MLEMIREYAQELFLARAAGPEVIRRRHAKFILDLAESANLSLEAVGRPQRQELVLPEQHNLRAAIEWATDADVELGLRLAVAVENFWISHDTMEGARRFAALLERADDVDVHLRARAMRDYGGCLDMAGDNERAELAYARSRELFGEAGDERGVAEADFRLGVTAASRQDLKLARVLWERSLEISRRLDDASGELQALGNLGWLEFEEGNPEKGRELTERSLAMGRAVGFVWWELMTLASLAERALEAGSVEDSQRRARDVLERANAIGDRSLVVRALALLAHAAAERGEAQQAATLWAAAEAEAARAQIARWAPVRDKHASAIPQRPGQVEVLALQDAVEYALGVRDE
jgi:tetratricopeptide (TPR) repeat protein